MSGLVLAVDLDLDGQVAGRNLLRHADGPVQGFLDPAGYQPGKSKDHHGQQCCSPENLDARLCHLFFDIIDVDTAANDPAPLLHQLYIGDLVHRFCGAGLCPLVLDDSFSLIFRQLRKFDKDLLAVGVLDIGHILADQILVCTMGKHLWFKVVDPEVFVAVIPDRPDSLQSPLLGFRQRECAGFHLRLIPLQQRINHVNNALGRQFFFRQQIVLHVWQEIKRYSQYQQRDGGN